VTGPSNPPAPLAAPLAVPREVVGTYRPADAWGFLRARETQLRHAFWVARAQPRGTVLLLPGRTEFIEKYASEVVGELLDRGFAVAMMDWRGQGLSDRPLPDPDKGHIDRFETYLADLRLYLDAVLGPDTPRPLLALGHSMGAHLFLRFHSLHGSTPFDAAVVTAPMMGLKREGLLRNVLRLTPPITALDRSYLYGAGPFRAAQQKFAGNVLTHDERRFRFTEQWFAADPRLSLGGPTIGWCRQAVRSMDAALAPGALERIDLPLLLLSSGADDLVDTAIHGIVASRIRTAQHVTIDGARHEAMMETDNLRARFWIEFDRFTKERLG
jgi:lysophospholipase